MRASAPDWRAFAEGEAEVRHPPPRLRLNTEVLASGGVRVILSIMSQPLQTVLLPQSEAPGIVEGSVEWLDIEMDVCEMSNPDLAELYNHVVHLVEVGYEIKGIALVQFIIAGREGIRRGMLTLS